MPRELADGIYEHLVTEELESALAALEPARKRVITHLDDGDAHIALARHLGREVERALAALSREGRAEMRRAACASARSISYSPATSTTRVLTCLSSIRCSCCDPP
jgi:hypothetical protein